MMNKRALWGVLAVFAFSLPVVAQDKLDAGVAEMGFHYPFDERTGNFVMTTTATVKDGKLIVGLAEERGFKQYAMGFGFRGVMDGTETRYGDSDAAQIAVLFVDESDVVLGRTTNATPQLPKRGPKFPGAHWKVVGTVEKGKPTNLIWEASIPERTVHMNIVVVYTDTLTNPPYSAAKDRKRTSESGDLPLITASFSAFLAEDKWMVVARPQDVDGTRKFKTGQFPTVAQIEDTITAVKGLVSQRTGYQILARPNRLDGISAPIEVNYRDLQKMVDAAIKDGEINQRTDTGFDLITEPVAPVVGPREF